jgi:NAD(P)-dependent dehydrogenase (short-subunit alcohol dehydrogenase family)
MQGKIAVVTGANSGFGRATVEALHQDGWRVFATMRNTEGRNADAAKALRDLGAGVVELDVLSDASVDAAARSIIQQAGAPDLLVNNAGTAFFGPQEAFTPEAVERQFATNVFGPLRVDRAFLPAMRERGTGLIVFVSSVVGRVLLPFSGPYTSSKWALEALAEILSYEVSPFGVDVTLVQPGAYPTDLFSRQAGPDDEDRAKAYAGTAHYAERIQLGLLESAQGRKASEVADAIVAVANMPAGRRPLRVPVPEEGPATGINSAVAPIQAETLRSFGLEALLSRAAV